MQPVARQDAPPLAAVEDGDVVFGTHRLHHVCRRPDHHIALTWAPVREAGSTVARARAAERLDLPSIPANLDNEECAAYSHDEVAEVGPLLHRPVLLWARWRRHAQLLVCRVYEHHVCLLNPPPLPLGAVLSSRLHTQH
eukprot:scaffold148700_cov34-Tisochrysis_lutea.AAC.1